MSFKEIVFVNINAIKIKGISIEISIALHSSKDVWLPCKMLKVATDEEVDVAVLQLDCKQLPNTVL